MCKKHSSIGQKTILTVKAVQSVVKEDALGRTVIAGKQQTLQFQEDYNFDLTPRIYNLLGFLCVVWSPHTTQLQTFPQNDLEKFIGLRQQAPIRPRNPVFPIKNTSVHQYPQGPSLSQMRVFGTAEIRLREEKKPVTSASQTLLQGLLSTPSPSGYKPSAPPTPIPKASPTIAHLGKFRLLDPSQTAEKENLKPGAIFERSRILKNTGIC